MKRGTLNRLLGPVFRGEKAFTVVEVLIVIAVTGFIFISTVLLIAGRQQQTEFNQAARDIQSQIQQVINDVATGFYPNYGGLNCAAGVDGPTYTSSGGQQGTNEGCIFLGKAIQFGIAGTAPEQLRVYTVGGLQKGGAGEVESYSEAQPKVVAPSVSNPSTPDQSEIDQLLYGLSTYEVFYGTVKTNVGSLAILSSLDHYSSQILSGSQSLSVVPIDGSALNTSVLQGAEAIDNNLATSPVNPASGVSLCFVSGGTEQSALIKIGGSGRQLSVTLDIKSNTTCS